MLELIQKSLTLLNQIIHIVEHIININNKLKQIKNHKPPKLMSRGLEWITLDQIMVT